MAAILTNAQWWAPPPPLFQQAEPVPGDIILLDGTLTPVHDQNLTHPSKDYRQPVNVQVTATPGRRVTHVSLAWPRNRNDITVAKAIISYCLSMVA